MLTGATLYSGVQGKSLKTSEQVGTCTDQLLITGGSPQSFFFFFNEILGLFCFPIFSGLLGVILNKLV